jgi:hypothetical protein
LHEPSGLELSASGADNQIAISLLTNRIALNRIAARILFNVAGANIETSTCPKWTDTSTSVETTLVEVFFFAYDTYHAMGNARDHWQQRRF